VNSIALIILLAVVILLIFRKSGNQDSSAQDCAREVIDLLKAKPDASAQEIATILKAHGRNSASAGQVTRLVKTRLTQARIRKNDQQDVMLRVRQAKQMLQD